MLFTRYIRCMCGDKDYCGHCVCKANDGGFYKKYKFEDEVVYPLIQSFDVERWSIKWGENKRDRYKRLENGGLLWKDRRQN